MKYDLAILKQIILSSTGEEMLPRFTDVQFSNKVDGRFVTEADLAVQARITHNIWGQSKNY